MPRLRRPPRPGDVRGHGAASAGAVILVLLGLAASFPLAGDGSLPAASPLRDSEEQVRGMPPAFPHPAVPADNPMTANKVELGRHLFYDRRLSGTGTFACASCHQQARAFTDGRGQAIGATGERHPRGAMSLANVAYNASFGWADPRTTSLEAQALIPMLNTEPVELGLVDHEDQVLDRLRSDRFYQRTFRDAFPTDPEPIRIETITRALATFERTILSGGSRFDRYAFRGELSALSPAELRGLELFFSPQIGCSACHSGFNFSGPVRWHEGPRPALRFHDNGLQTRAARTAPSSRGLEAYTGRDRDRAKFRAPTLRNIELTSPYMHDGRLASLEEVLDHYLGATGSLGLRGPATGPVTPQDRADLMAFLKSLTDHELVTDERLADPFSSRAP